MRIIKLEIEVLTASGRIKIAKQALSLNKKICDTVRDFVEYVKHMCDLTGHYQIEVDGFALASKESVKILKENRVYRLKTYNKQKTFGKIGIQQSQNSCSHHQSFDKSLDEDSSSNIAAKRRASVVRSQPLKVSKVQQKKNKRIQKSKAKQYNLQNSEQQQDQSQSQQLLIGKNVQQVAKNSDKPHKKQQSNRISIKDNVVPLHLRPTKPARLITKKVQSASQSQSSSEDLPKLMPQKKVATPSVPPKRQIPKKTVKNTVSVPQKPASKVAPKVTAKKIINQSSSSSESSQVKLAPPKPSAIKKKVVVDSSSQSSLSPQAPPQKARSQPTLQQKKSKPQQNVKLPFALRNKPAPTKQFSQHKETQWLPVDKQKYKKWVQKGHAYFCQPPNKIRFKIVELDQQKFVPVMSGWITAQVSSVSQQGMIHMVNAQQQGRQFRKQLQIPEHNMNQLQIYRLLASQQQLECLLDDSSMKDEAQKKEQPVEKEQTELKQKTGQANQDSTSVQKFVCGQINYYFSDRSYPTDPFMLLHANSHPQKYVKVSFMLNFPKIKKVLKDEQKLIQYLRQDQKYDTRNYQVDFTQKLIRKKLPPPPPSPPAPQPAAQLPVVTAQND